MRKKNGAFLLPFLAALAVTTLENNAHTGIAWAQTSRGPAPGLPAPGVSVDLSNYKSKNGVTFTQSGSQLRAKWPMDKGQFGVLALDLKQGVPLIDTLGIAPSAKGKVAPILSHVDPVTVLTVGTRNLNDPAGWVAFFDDPPKRPYQTYTASLSKSSAKVESMGARSTITIGGLSAGPFSGDLRFTFYPGTRLVHVETCVSTQRDASAILYDSGLTSAAPSWHSVSYLDSQDRWQSTGSGGAAQPVAVRYRAIMAESAAGSVAIFPPPHKYFYPLDDVDNFKFAWHGAGYRGEVKTAGFGIRQPLDGDKRHVPWYNAPPGTLQKLGMFYLLSPGKAADALAEVRRFTHDDRFPKLDGYKTFSSHYHVEHSLDFDRRQREQNTTGVPRGLENPQFVDVFKKRGVDIVHLAEFHVDWNPIRARRLELLKKMHEECARLSSPDFLLLPGEEPNVHLGGHWLSFFPKPVYWTLTRDREQPFVEQVPGYGTVYHVGSPLDVQRLIEAEKGLMWTAHPRIKGSITYPDTYMDKAFFHSDRFLGGAWKSMPADLSKPQLGTRVLDLEDDMANMGLRKYIPGEVDVFAIDDTSELYAHMNINYLKLKSIPSYRDGWQSVVDAVQGGHFFVTTGEVLIPKFSIGGKESGATLAVKNSSTALQASLQWTFPLGFAEIISGDGKNTYRQRIDLSDTRAFSKRDLKLNVDLSQRTWARLEVWDLAGNGAFTQPVWIESSARPKQVIKAPLPSPGRPEITAPIGTPATFARFIPGRDDFAWENDLVAFRTFGPALRSGAEDSGIDCWLKRVNYPIINRWYEGDAKGIPYHDDNGEGHDAYDVGSSRGCGGNGIWKNGKLYISDTFIGQKLISQTPQSSVFELSYDYDVEGDKIREVKRITIGMGSRLFRSESTFTQNGQPIALDIGIGITTHAGKATATLNPKEGWMACWEKIGDYGLGTGVVIAPEKVIEMREIKSTDANLAHALFITRTDAAGKSSWSAGYGWERAGAITSSEKWNAYLKAYPTKAYPTAMQ
jgi:hypothetical protein